MPPQSAHFPQRVPYSKVRSARITDGEDGSNGTIKLNLPVGIDLTSLSPEVDYAGEGFYYTVDDQRSDKTEEIDFTKKIGLVVYNTEYETEATYDVFVTAEKSVENDILSYKIGDAVGTISGSRPAVPDQAARWSLYRPKS